MFLTINKPKQNCAIFFLFYSLGNAIIVPFCEIDPYILNWRPNKKQKFCNKLSKCKKYTHQYLKLHFSLLIISLT